MKTWKDWGILLGCLVAVGVATYLLSGQSPSYAALSIALVAVGWDKLVRLTSDLADRLIVVGLSMLLFVAAYTFLDGRIAGLNVYIAGYVASILAYVILPVGFKLPNFGK